MWPWKQYSVEYSKYSDNDFGGRKTEKIPTVNCVSGLPEKLWRIAFSVDQHGITIIMSNFVASVKWLLSTRAPYNACWLKSCSTWIYTLRGSDFSGGVYCYRSVCKMKCVRLKEIKSLEVERKKKIWANKILFLSFYLPPALNIEGHHVWKGKLMSQLTNEYLHNVFTWPLKSELGFPILITVNNTRYLVWLSHNGRTDPVIT